MVEYLGGEKHIRRSLQNRGTQSQKYGTTEDDIEDSNPNVAQIFKGYSFVCVGTFTHYANAEECSQAIIGLQRQLTVVFECRFVGCLQLMVVL